MADELDVYCFLFKKMTFAFKTPHNAQSHQMGNVIDDGIFCTMDTMISNEMCLSAHPQW